MPEQHGHDKEAEADDPMELIGTPAPGNQKYMARCFVEEYVRMGKSKKQLMSLFENPFFESAHNMLERFGKDTIEGIIDDVLDDHSGYEYEESVTRREPPSSEPCKETDDNG